MQCMIGIASGAQESSRDGFFFLTNGFEEYRTGQRKRAHFGHLMRPSLEAIASKADLRGPSPATMNLADGKCFVISAATDKKRPGPFSGARRPTKPITCVQHGGRERLAH